MNVESISNLRYIATHTMVSQKDDKMDGWDIASLEVMLKEKYPKVGTDDERIQWWFKAEAKLKVEKAKALLAELEKQQ